jgi:hypothetical protein
MSRFVDVMVKAGVTGDGKIVHQANHVVILAVFVLTYKQTQTTAEDVIGYVQNTNLSAKMGCV